jgi:hypothetical protein
MRSNGGFLGPKKAVSPSAASGIWSLAQAQQDKGNRLPHAIPSGESFIFSYNISPLSSDSFIQGQFSTPLFLNIMILENENLPLLSDADVVTKKKK